MKKIIVVLSIVLSFVLLSCMSGCGGNTTTTTPDENLTENSSIIDENTSTADTSDNEINIVTDNMVDFEIVTNGQEYYPSDYSYKILYNGEEIKSDNLTSDDHAEFQIPADTTLELYQTTQYNKDEIDTLKTKNLIEVRCNGKCYKIQMHTFEKITLDFINQQTSVKNSVGSIDIPFSYETYENTGISSLEIRSGYDHTFTVKDNKTLHMVNHNDNELSNVFYTEVKNTETEKREDFQGSYLAKEYTISYEIKNGKVKFVFTKIS